MKLEKIILWIVSVSFSYEVVSCLNILGVFQYQGKSHFYVFEPYLKELVRRGHNVTVISHFPQEQPIKNYHDISLAGKTEAYEGAFPVQRSYFSTFNLLSFLYEMGRRNCEVMLADNKVQNLWKSKTSFDLVVIEQFNSDCALGLAYKLGAPVVALTSHVLLPWHYNPLGIEYNPSYMPLLLLEGGTKPSLYQRIERTILHNIANVLYKYNCQKVNEYQIQKHFEIPPLEDLARDVKFMLIYTNFVLNGANLYPPNVIEVGGYHVAKPKELSKDLKEFIEGAEHGVIYISFGSMLQATSTPQDKVIAIVEAISELPQRVIWKWDESVLPGNPKNVLLSKWLPQNDILAHPNVLAFYSHCGMLGTTEAIYHGVPMIGMPIFGDQPANAAAVEESGLGVQIQLADLTKETLLHRIKTVLQPEFRNKVKELSRVWHDRPISAMDKAIYWTEFAARTKNYIFRSPSSTVPLYQYLYLDVIAIVVCISIGIIFAIKCVLSLFKTKPVLKSKKVKTK